MKPYSTIFDDSIFLTDGGLETTLIFHYGLELRSFAAFELLNTDDGRAALQRYYEPYLDIAAKYQKGFVLETPTWRANTDWAAGLSYNRDELRAINIDAVEFVKALAERHPDINPMIISGNIGPRGDGYKAENMMSIEEARNYHYEQIDAFASAGVDVVSAITLNYTNEAIGVALAAKSLQVPCVISFTVETDGRLPNGQSLEQAITETDKATDNFPLHYMINCAHPEHFKNVLEPGSHWMDRIKGLRANASTKSHAELDESTELDMGDSCMLAKDYAALKNTFANLQVFGGCCGTDHRHLEEICKEVFENS